MSYDEFLDIPVSVLKDLETILLLKSKYCMEVTTQERKLCDHMVRFNDEKIKSYELLQQKRQLEELFKK